MVRYTCQCTCLHSNCVCNNVPCMVPAHMHAHVMCAGHGTAGSQTRSDKFKPIRQLILQHHIKQQAPPDCATCIGCGHAATVACNTCGAAHGHGRVFLCASCDAVEHQHAHYHVRYHAHGGAMQPLNTNQFLDGNCHVTGMAMLCM